MQISRIEIAKKLKQLKSIVPPKDTIGTKGVLLKGNMLIASNIELTVTTKLDIENDEEFVIPGAAIDLIEALDSDYINLKCDKEKVIVKSERGTSRFQTVPVDIFPDVVSEAESQDKLHLFKCSGVEFAESMNKIIYASSVIEGRPIANAVNLNGRTDQTADMVCCDGHQLACLTNYKCSNNFNVVVPRATVQKAVTLASSEDVDIYAIGTSKILFEMGEYKVYSSLVNGKFIDYSKAIPTSFGIKAKVNKDEIIGTVTRAKICADNSGKKPIAISIDENSLTISVKSTLSEFSETIELDTPAEQRLEIGFNPNLLINALKANTENELTLCFNSAVSPLLIKSEETFKQIVLPCRL